MRILFLGDVVGRAGRRAVQDRLAGLRDAWALDFVVVNAENATSGNGLNGDHAKALPMLKGPRLARFASTPAWP